MPVSWSKKDNKLLFDARKDLRRAGLTTKSQITQAIQKRDLATDHATLRMLCRWCGIMEPAAGKTVKFVRPTEAFRVPVNEAGPMAKAKKKAKASNTPTARRKAAQVKAKKKSNRKLANDIKQNLADAGVINTGMKAKPKKIEKIEKTPASKPKLKMKPGDKRKNNGGKRAGSGRKPGPTKLRTKGLADDYAADTTKIMPLEYMLDVLNETPDQLLKDYKANKMDAAEFMVQYKALVARRDWAAEKAAVYLHPRLSAITASITTPAHEQFVKDCEAEAAALIVAAANK